MTPGVRRLLAFVLLGVLPVVTAVAMFALAHDSGSLARDFHNELYPEAKLLLDWENPFPGPDQPLEYGTTSSGRPSRRSSSRRYGPLARRGRLGGRDRRARLLRCSRCASSASATGGSTAPSRSGRR